MTCKCGHKRVTTYRLRHEDEGEDKLELSEYSDIDFSIKEWDKRRPKGCGNKTTTNKLFDTNTDSNTKMPWKSNQNNGTKKSIFIQDVVD